MNFFDLYKNCTLCPRNCNVDRNIKLGFCDESSDLSIASFLLHSGEEPCISHNNGSGTIFFTGCSLRCPFCQNKQISQSNNNAHKYSLSDFISIIDDLLNKNAENINFVTPDHFLPHIIECIKILKKNNINTSFIYNSSGFQSIKNLEISLDYLDIYLFDYKFAEKEASVYCLNNSLYPEVSLKALEYLLKNKGNLVIDDKGKAQKGVIVRHLVMPGFIENSIKVINDLYFNFGKDVYISIMSQYSPIYLQNGFEKINRRLLKTEYDEVSNLVKNLGFNNGFIQEYIDYNDEYIPDFNTKNVF